MVAAIRCTRQKPGHDFSRMRQTTAKEKDCTLNTTYLFGRNLDTDLLNGFGKFFWLNGTVVIKIEVLESLLKYLLLGLSALGLLG